ncbi:hypothetical protein OXPF_05020 [Oxobacter pfennigii]|uniref:Uncharacterized protein n=2 Tax=Oxobacter pfennigii TaxID=36849 RepID=A0A0P8YG74_9CLOT|nr:hypothetical protein OXPF_05020 [Oxobacter pfennigii]
MWLDFTITNKLDVPYMGILLNYECSNEQGATSLKWTYMAKSILKLESLGVLQLDFMMTTGTSSPNNIERFHITLFGQKILGYIKEVENGGNLNHIKIGIE